MNDWNRSLRAKNGKFQNEIPAAVKMGAADMVSLLRDFLSSTSQRRPKQPLPIVPVQSGTLRDGKDKFIWFGHSASLLQIERKTILIDPMLGKNPSPIPLSRNRRYSVHLPITIEELPPIDIVVLSHDHYDHLDSSSIRKLIPKAGVFLVPLGVGKRIRKLGASPDAVIELDWGEERIIQGIRFVCTPARHFSGRGLFDRDSTLWCSYVIKTEERSLFYSGDGGYGPHFERIGKQHGPFELAIMECGQYDKRWSGVHMFPEETLQAYRDVQGGVLLPVHWGGFTLALHDWNDPARRISAAAEKQRIPYRIPKIGEVVYLESIRHSTQQDLWWREQEGKSTKASAGERQASTRPI
ncbi:MBL fold metallo-hydrolase [Cohnella zeiphila]|uniref:MBL fold metallo-hydrolase n=1 Tax=Cohnella zeiphila TaxID=2761120 RepID=A0A7X0SQS3_9BACL|nr:MBL fold metallo-hydrolase [Cohnella zeiphila]MBB6734428.1 MBL fold metallo-hydrolase [Cohnella zeiphila]